MLPKNSYIYFNKNRKNITRLSKALMCFFIFLFIIFNPGFAQGGFKKQYYFNNSITAKCRDVIEAPNGNIIMIGITVDTLNNSQFNRLTICVADAQGTKLFEKRYGRANFQYLDNIIGSRCPLIKDATGFYASLAVLDSNNKYLSTLIRFNYNGDTLWQKKYYDVSTDNLYVMDIAKTVDNSLIFTGIFEGTNRQILLIKTDLTGNELWRKKIPNSPISSPWWASRIIQDSATKKLVIAGNITSGTNIYTLILKTDSLGNNPVVNGYFAPNRGGLNDLKQLPNKDFVAVGFLGINNTTNYRGQVICFNINGSLVWANNIDAANITNNMLTVNVLSDGNIIVGGQIDTLNIHNIAPSDKIRITKMRPDGSIIWKKYYRTLTDASDAGETLTSFNPTSDGGFLFSTNFIYKQNPRPYSIYKIDSTGCDSTTAYCQTMTGMDELGTTIGNLKIYPNPANSVINIDGFLFNSTSKSYTFKIINVLGQQMLSAKTEIVNSKTQFNIGGLQNGIYFLQVFLDNKLVTSQKIIKE